MLVTFHRPLVNDFAMIKSVRGTSDILPGDVRLWQTIEREMRDLFELYAFSEIRTPIFELTELFVRGVGEDTDIVSKEMYTFLDRDQTTSLTLRPEGTAPVVRSYIENRLAAESRMVKLYYIGPMFRRDRPQKGRTRQFHQAGVEVLSATDESAIEAEIIEMLFVLFGRLGVMEPDLIVNSIGCNQCRPPYVERLREEISKRASGLCGDCVRRAETNPLRVLDCKVPTCQGLIAELPAITRNLCEECALHFDRFKGYLDDREIPYRVEERLVRGLDYYTRTTFEIKSSALGAQDSLVAGGRYDGLAEDLDGPSTKGFGFGMGLERLILSIPEPEKLLASSGPQYFLATIGDDAFRYATLLARKLRAAGSAVYLDFDGRSLKSQMRLANKIQAARVVVLGENEVRSKRLTVRDMTSKEEIDLTEDELVEAATIGREK
jgi:histidyl-tRNA synthetase